MKSSHSCSDRRCRRQPTAPSACHQQASRLREEMVSSRSHKATRQLTGKSSARPARLAAKRDSRDPKLPPGCCPIRQVTPEHQRQRAGEMLSTRSQVATRVLAGQATMSQAPQAACRPNAIDPISSSHTGAGRSDNHEQTTTGSVQAKCYRADLK